MEVFYNILFEFGIPMKLVRLIKYVWMKLTAEEGKHLSNMFPIRNGLKQGDVLLPLHFNCAVEYAVRRFQVHQDDLKLYDTHQRLVYADDVNIFGSSLHTV
jgi:hypothetical protein